MKPRFSPFCDRCCVKNKLGDRMITIIGLSYRKISWFVSVSQMSYDLLATDKSGYFVQPRPIIVNNLTRFQIE